jgi:hypothetical protein
MLVQKKVRHSGQSQPFWSPFYGKCRQSCHGIYKCIKQREWDTYKESIYGLKVVNFFDDDVVVNGNNTVFFIRPASIEVPTRGDYVLEVRGKAQQEEEPEMGWLMWRMILIHLPWV